MTEVKKAVRAVVMLGDISLDVFQFPNGEYRMSQSQILNVVGIEPKRYTEIRDSKVGKSLGMPTFDLYRITVENKAKANTLAMADVPLVWRVCAKLKRGNQELLDNILDACLIEALERRADKAFDVKRTEEEYNQRFKVRMEGKVARRSLTYSISDYCLKRGDKRYTQWIFARCSDYLNQVVLGVKAKQAKEYYQVPENSLLRDYVPVAALRELELAENLASRFIDEEGVECLEAIKKACKIAFVKYVGLIEK